jgi:hypothetical protein
MVSLARVPRHPTPRVGVALCLGLIALVLAALGGCGGGGNSGPPPPPSYTVAGTVSDPLTGEAVAQVGLQLVLQDGGAGTSLGTATTDSAGHYLFTDVLAGSYTINPTLDSTVFTPALLAVAVINADVTGQDFQAIRGARLASGIQFLPSTFVSDETFRLSLVVQNGFLLFTDSSDQPLKKLSLANSAVTPLAGRFTGAQGVALHGTNVYWISGDQLNQSTLAGVTKQLAQGTRNPVTSITSDIVADDDAVYWVITDLSSACDPPCDDLIQRVPLDGSAPVTLATSDRHVVALTEDADHIYWEEDSMEPVSPGCHCGSTVKSIPKTGGAVVVLVDGSLNGTMPNPGPGYIPGSWSTTGGLAVAASQVVFGFSTGLDQKDQLKSVGLQGGAITTLATGGTIKNIRAEGTSAYWIDTAAGTLDSTPLAGGSVATLASGLGGAVALRLTASSALWSDGGPTSGCCLQTGMGSVKSVPLGGGTVSTLVAGLDAPAALDADAEHLAWTELSRVASAAAAGGGTTTLASGIANSLARIAADQNNVYILDGELVKVLPLAGGTLERLAAATTQINNPGGPIPPIGSINPNGDIATDGTSVYWTADGAGPTVQKVSVAGGAPVTLAVDALNTSAQPCYWRIAVDAQNVYWTSDQTTSPVGCSVRKVPVGGGAASTVVDYPNLRDFTVDAGVLYFAELGGRTIQKIATDGGATALVVSGASPSLLTNGSGRLVWLEGGLGVNFVSEAGGMPISVGCPLSDPSLVMDALAVDSSGLYCATGQAGQIEYLH